MDKNDLLDTTPDESDFLFTQTNSLTDELDASLAGIDLNFTSEDLPYFTPEAETPETVFPGETDYPRRSRKPQTDEEPSEAHSGLGDFIVRHRLMINLTLLLVCLGLIIGIAAVILLQRNADPLDGKILENVYIAGIHVGGMTKDEAITAVNAGMSDIENTMLVELGENQLTLSSSQARPTLNVQAAVDAAFSFGRSGSASQQQKDYRNAQNAPVEISGLEYLSINTNYVRSTVSDFLDSLSGEFSPSGYSLEGERPALDADGFNENVPCQTLVLETGTPGSQFDLDGICDAIYEGYCQNNFHVIISAEYLPQLPEKLDIDAIYQQLHVDAVEASEENGTFIPGSCGYTFDLENARSQLNAAGYGQVISIPMEYVIPSRLGNDGTFTEILSTCSTPVSSNEAYNQNMLLLCQKLDGLILEPGEIFSFDLFFKDRTEQNGYQMAPRHAGCCIEEEVCGGMDQVASTLYVAAKTADLTIREKHLADHLCSYTTKGTELTVSTAWQDLKFSNSQKSPLKIRARVSNGQVIIQFLSEETLTTYIKLETTEVYAIKSGTFYASKKASEGFTNGQVLIEGVDGSQVILNWIKYDKATDAEVSRTSEYLESRPMDTVVVNIVG